MQSFVPCSIILASWHYFSRLTCIFFPSFIKRILFFWYETKCFFKICYFTVSFDFSNSVVYSLHTALLLQVFKWSSDKRVFLSQYECEVKYPKISQIVLSHVLAAVPWPYPTVSMAVLCPYIHFSHLEEEWAVPEREDWSVLGLLPSSTVPAVDVGLPLPTLVLSQPCMSQRQCHQRCPAAWASATDGFWQMLTEASLINMIRKSSPTYSIRWLWGISRLLSCKNFKTKQFFFKYITFRDNLPFFVMGHHQLLLHLWCQ